MKRKILVIASIAILLIVTTVVALYFWQTQQADGAPVANKPSFAFDHSKAPGWWSAGNNWPDIKDFTGDQVTATDLPVADIAVHHGTETKPDSSCFVMAFYQKGSVDLASELKKRETGMQSAGENPKLLTQVGTSMLSINTPEGAKEYTLYKYNLDMPQTQKGNAFGFIPLTSGYIEVRSVCPTAEQLAITLPALTAVALKG